ncbi:PRC-barrel domain containing protein [Xylanimonas oleitrophica]|uniref:PRC-barrel domain containing protein n=1 Tax=Xylanimonas oleitrophica TaxID=2607479 RepID=A0A2W5WMX5_9MICO|nr:PRC-barrel domain containing protein [Xylanimonas oleitrophica]PZR52530.1 PRC-barrel domain containing protein [Xylanimonas oleitrophica]
MIASDLLDARVLEADGQAVGWVVDLRLVLDGTTDGILARPRLHGLVVSPRTRTSFLGFERSDVRSPWPIAPLLRRWHRGTFLVHWPDVARVPEPDDADHPGPAVVVLRPGYLRYDATLHR